jgi:hypothetical protein
MDSDAPTLQSALEVLQRHFGERLSGPRQSAETQMRNTLQQELGLDEARAGDVLKELSATDRLAYVEDADIGSTAGAGETGPVISMPLTQSADGGTPLITAISPAMVMGIVDQPGADVGQIVESDEAEPPPTAAVEGEEAGADSAQGHWRIG